MAHIDEMTCLQYLDGALDAARGAQLRSHTEGCRECAALLRALQQESLLLQSAMHEADEPVPARLLNPAAKEKLPWVWMTLLGFASAGIYAVWTIVNDTLDTVSQAGFSGLNLFNVALFNSTFWSGWGDVMDMIQVLAALTLVVPAIWLVWRYRRRVSTAAMVLATMAGILALPSAAHAAEVEKSKQNYTLAAGDTVKDDLIVMGGNVRIDGTVEGDLIAFAQSVTVTGRVTGDLIVFTQRLRIEGTIEGDVRTFNNTMTLEGSVAKNVMVFCETLETLDKSEVGGSMTVFGKTITFDGRTARDMMAFGDNITLNGHAGGDVQMSGGHLTVGDSAVIQGKAEWRSRNEPDVSPKATLASAFEVTKPVRKARYSDPGFYFGQVIRFGVSLVFGIVILLLLPGFFREVVGATRQYGPAFGFGAISLIVVPILAVIACITIVGLAVGISSLLLYIIGLYSAKVIVGTWLGQQMLGRSITTGGLIGRMALGLAVLRIAAALPYIGGWITLAYCVWALGAIALTVNNRLRSGPALPAEPATVAV